MTEQLKSLTALIVGAGVGGLSAAIALAQRGINSTIVEQAPELGDVGAGIQLQPNATRVLRAMGIADQLKDVGVLPVNANVRMAKSGKVVFSIPRPGNSGVDPHYQIHRADFHKILVARARELGVTLVTGQTACSFQQSELGVTLETVSGESYKADVLIGADGVRSAIREAMFGLDEPEFTGNVAYRGLVDASKMSMAIEPAAILGPGSHFVIYYVRGGKLINFVAQQETESWTEEGWNIPSDVSELRAYYKDWDPQVTELLKHAESTFKWALYSRKPMPSWSEGAVGLIGDACHPALPNLASGAAMAIEDGYVIAELIDRFRDDIPTALNTFYDMRIDRCTQIQDGSKKNSELFHVRSPLERFIKYTPLILITKIAPKFAAKKLTWTHHYDATTAVEDWLNSG